MRLLLVGSTGHVGQHVLDLALADPRVTDVVAVVRRPLPERPKLVAAVVNFEQLPDGADWRRADAVICTLGTTMRTAGSKDAFRRVDKDYPLAVARLARQHGTPAYVLNSSMGANPSSRFFYNRVKGEVEREMSLLDLPSLTIVRPGLVGGRRRDRRPAEMVGGLVSGMLAPLLLQRFRVDPAARITRVLTETTVEAAPGECVIASADLRLHRLRAAHALSATSTNRTSQ
jgi:uncharacterized protein YbjT (DUF2867 family)